MTEVVKRYCTFDVYAEYEQYLALKKRLTSAGIEFREHNNTGLLVIEYTHCNTYCFREEIIHND